MRKGEGLTMVWVSSTVLAQIILEDAVTAPRRRIFDTIDIMANYGRGGGMGQGAWGKQKQENSELYG
jgi:hypothetical protein